MFDTRKVLNPISPAVYYGGATIKQRDMNKVKKAIRSLNPAIRTAIILVVAFIAAMLSGFFFGHYLSSSSPITFFALVVFATFVIVGIYTHLIEDDDE